jgi:hypothetical protein
MAVIQKQIEEIEVSHFSTTGTGCRKQGENAANFIDSNLKVLRNNRDKPMYNEFLF